MVGALTLGSGVHAGAPAEEAPLSADHQRARELSWSGDYDDSLALYAGLQRERPHDVDLELEVGRVLLWAGRENEALERFEQVLYADPAHAEARLSAGRALYYQGRHDEATPHYKLALPSYEDDPAVVAEAVRVFGWSGQTRLAERWLRRGLERHPADPDLRVAQAMAEIDTGELEPARVGLEAVLAEHPDHAGAREQLEALRSGKASLEAARRHGYAGRYGRAKRLLRSHLEERPDDREARLQLARFAAWSGDYGESQQTYRTLLREDPADTELRVELADVTSWRGQYATAMKLYGKLHREDPSDLRVRLGQANVHLWSGVHRLADRDLRALLALDPDHEPARKQLARLDQQRAPTILPELAWFSDSEDFTLLTPSTSVRISPKPGRNVSLALDTPRAEGKFFELDPVSGLPVERSEDVEGVGFRLAFSERPDRAYEFGGEIGAVTYSGADTSPRARLHATWYPDYRHSFHAAALHEDALPSVRSIQSATEGIERSALQLVHSYRGERFTSWTMLDGGHYSDDPNYWMARTVLGFGLLRRPFELDLLGLASAGAFDERSPYYYSPDNVAHYAVGLRLKKSLPGRADFVLIGEVGRIREDGFTGDTLRIAPELRLEISPRLEIALRYDHFQSMRSGAGYESDFASAQLTWRFPVTP
jgi:tetratricopeptide (TPR) repeat protein